jgi:prevent-host-death family protein
MRVYTYSEARQNFASVLETAQIEGSVRITRRDGRIFVVQPVRETRSPLDVPGVDTQLSRAEILTALRESRERG